MSEPQATMAGATSLSPSLVGRTRLVERTVFSLVIAITVFLVVLPLYKLLVASFGGWGLTTPKYFIEILHSRELVGAIGNSLALGVLCAALSVLVGGPLAWLVCRTDLPFRRTLRLVILCGFIAPGFVSALAWILLTGPNAGYLNKLWLAASGLAFSPFNIFSWSGLLFVCFTTVYPLAFILIHNALLLQDVEVEEAARVMGASRIRILATITFPIALPAIAASFIICALETFILYGAPSVIGAPAGISVVTTALAHLFEYPPQLGLAAALSIVLIVVTLILLLLQTKVVGKRSRATLRGKGGRMDRVHLGRSRWPLFIVVAIIAFTTVALPYGTIIAAAFMSKFYVGFTWSNITLSNFYYVLFQFPSGPVSIRNSVICGAFAAFGGVILGLVSAYLVRRRLVIFGQALAFLATAPIVIPGMALAVAAYALYSSGPLRLYGTIWILAGDPYLPRAVCDFVIQCARHDLETGRWSSGRYSGCRSILSG